MDVLKEIGVALVTSSLVGSLFVWFLKQYLDKRLAYEFRKRESLFTNRLEQAGNLEKRLTDGKMGVYPELMELTYRLSVAIRDGLTQPGAAKWNPELRPLCAQLTESLFRYRFFLDDELFQLLHEFKHIAQDATLLVDIHTRPDKAFDSDQYNRSLRSFEARQQRSGELVHAIHGIIAQRLNEMRQVS